MEHLVNFYETTENHLLVIPADGFKIEALGEVQDSNENDANHYENCKLEHVDEDADYYRKHFSDGG